MAAQNIVAPPPHHPGMAELHRRVLNTVRVHWIKHPGKKPQKLVLTQKQAEDMALCHLYGASSMGSAYKVDRTKFYDRPVEVSDSTELGTPSALPCRYHGVAGSLLRRPHESIFNCRHSSSCWLSRCVRHGRLLRSRGPGNCLAH